MVMEKLLKRHRTWAVTKRAINSIMTPNGNHCEKID